MENPECACIPGTKFFFNWFKLLNSGSQQLATKTISHRSHVQDIALRRTAQFMQP
jgi:hypothetical protein